MTPASIWVDADACPNVIKEILFRAAERTGVCVTLVANQPLQIPRIASLRAVQVSSGFDVADSEIVKRLAAGDLVITADIPLAAEVIAKGGEALNPRGERYSPDTIRGVLAMRDFMDTMRSSGNVGGGPPPLTLANRNAFAAHLDAWLARRPGSAPHGAAPGSGAGPGTGSGPVSGAGPGAVSGTGTGAGSGGAPGTGPRS